MGGRGAESYDVKTVLYTVNHSILSGVLTTSYSKPTEGSVILSLVRIMTRRSAILYTQFIPEIISLNHY